MLKMHWWLFDLSLNSTVRILGSKLQRQDKENEDSSFRQGGALVASGQKLETGSLNRQDPVRSCLLPEAMKSEESPQKLPWKAASTIHSYYWAAKR